MNQETWKFVSGYEGFYEVSNLGRVRSVPRDVERYGHMMHLRGKVLANRVGKAGYLSIHLMREAIFDWRSIHRLVAEAFVKNEYGKGFVNHKDGNKGNNAADNLEWVTRSENALHMTRVLKKSCGERHAKSKLTDDDVIEMRLLRFYGARYSDMVPIYGVTHPTVRMACLGVSWRFAA